MTRLLCPWNSPGKNTRVGCHCLFQGIFPTSGLNLGLPHCRQILYLLSDQGSPVPSSRQEFSRCFRNICWVEGTACARAWRLRETPEDFPGGPVAKTPCPQCRGAQVQSLIREKIPHAAAKDPAYCNEDQRPCMPQLRPDVAK